LAIRFRDLTQPIATSATIWSDALNQSSTTNQSMPAREPLSVTDWKSTTRGWPN